MSCCKRELIDEDGDSEYGVFGSRCTCSECGKKYIVYPTKAKFELKEGHLLDLRFDYGYD